MTANQSVSLGTPPPECLYGSTIKASTYLDIYLRYFQIDFSIKFPLYILYILGNTMQLHDLHLGDIIFVRSGSHDFVHVGICVESGGTFATTKMAHTLGKMHPYCLVATYLATKEILDARDLQYIIIRRCKVKCIKRATF